MLLLATLLMAAPADWVPARWPSGDPATLELLTGTPVNCLLVETAQWSPAFAKAASARKIAVIGVARSEADLQRAAPVKLDGIVLEGRISPALSEAARKASGVVIELPNRADIRFDRKDQIIGSVQGLWPGVVAEHGGRTVLGPTSSPWVNTNGGFLRFVRAASDATVWFGVRPPPATVYPVERYAQAIGDAALVGARWIVALDDDLSARLMARDPAALRDWKKIGDYLTYYETRPEWRRYRAYARMAVIQGAASGALLSGSLLDMLASTRTSVRVVPPNRFSGETLKDTKVLLDVDPDSLTAEQKRAIDAFVAGGGVVIHPPSKWRFPETSDDQIQLNRRQADQLQSLWEVTYNSTVRKNFGMRAFNTTGILSSILASPDGRKMLAHMVNFLDFPGESMTIHVLGKWKKARLYRFGEAPVDLEVFEVPDGTGVEVDRLPLLATIEYE